MNLEDIKDRCTLDEDTGCWHWKGALSNGKWPRIRAPNHCKPGSPMQAQTGRRAVWHIKTGVAIPQDHRVYGTCTDPQCLNPEHMRCGPPRDWGKHAAKTGVYKNNVKRQIASRRTGRSRALLTPALIFEIQNSTETGREISRRTGLSAQTVSKARNGKSVCFEPIGGFASGLGARA